ncbi:MAG: allantoicase [Deltaproteobacteria bacterium]|nr:allantoicase [Deltaproteobacteria bacterium]
MIVEAPARPGPPFTDLPDLASARVGGAALACSDDFFASMTNLLSPARAVFDPHAYGERGKVMDGWESRRSFGRVAGHTHDWCVIKLGMPGTLRGVDVDTSFFRGNYPEAAAIDACEIDDEPDAAALLDPSVAWTEVLPRTELRGDDSNFAPFRVTDRRFTHLRLRIEPDGGVARLRVFGVVSPDWRRLSAMGAAIDLAAIENGGQVIAANDMFFGSRHNLIMPGRSVNMGDGWETRRKRREGHDWTIVRLGRRGLLRSFEVDTNHFKGNFPESCWIDGVDAPDGEDPRESSAWFPLLPRTKLRAHTRHSYAPPAEGVASSLSNLDRPCTHVRLSIHPDGGISRLRVHGVPT